MALRKIRRVDHEERVELVDHLDELRSRLIVSATALGVAVGLCFWRNDLVLAVMNRPLHGKQPITLSPAEAFTTTFTLSAYAALILTLPVLLYQLYAFVIPAFGKREKKAVALLVGLVPVLFVAGAAFAYYIVIPAALSFLLNFNADQFRTELRAREYYGFAAMTMVSVGVLFQVPVGVLALTRLGIVTPRQLRAKRRYAYLGCTVLAALLPGVDPVTMIVETIPLLLLYEGSILLASALGSRVTSAPAPTAAPR
ncbi:MAG: sec-independent protein translocase protein TatC [Thermoleophilales bacterium]|jgi:sec-independent protein translocase protein TatC|nr:sec-independent protein translocase protein TatC [Thermoleophilales bacterium]